MSESDLYTTLKINPNGKDPSVIRRNFAIIEKIFQNLANGVGPTPLDLLAWYDTVSPSPDGATTTFTTASSYLSGTLQVYRDHSRLVSGVDFTETGANTFSVTEPPDADEILRVGYIKVST